MRKTHILVAAFFAVLACSAIAAASASAVPNWLVGGVEPEVELPATWAWSFTFALLPSEIAITCNGFFLGKIGPGTEDLIEKIQDLAGKEPADCEVTKGGTILNVFKCNPHELALLKGLRLPWKTLLVLESGVVWDKISNGGAGVPAPELECSKEKGKITCEGEVKAKFVENLVGGGSVFEFNANSGKPSCPFTGQTVDLTGKGEVTSAEGAVSVDT